MHADHHVRTPLLKLSGDVTNRAFIEELAGVGTKSINQPVVILHPVLLVSQQPVVDGNELGSEMMRFFDGADDANSIRLALDEAFDARHNRRRRGTMTAAGVGRNDENFRSVLHVRTAWGSG